MSHNFPFAPALRRLRWLALCALLAACASEQVAPPRVTLPGEDVAGTSPPGGVAGEVALTESAYAPLFADAEDALARRDWMAAELARPATQDASREDADYQGFQHYLSAAIAFLRGEPARMREQLAAVDLRAVSPALALRVHRLSLQQHQLAGDVLASARTASAVLDILGNDDPQSPAIARQLSLDLQHLETGALRTALEQVTSASFAAWLQRLLALRAGESKQAWLADHPGHPAALLAGADLPAAGAARRVALLLPLSGQLAAAAVAVRDGFLASRFAAGAGSAAAADLTVIDTDLFASNEAAYAAAVAAGAELVVGPLTKLAVGELLALPTLPVPILALNRNDDGPMIHTNALQFALAPEDEAAQVARIALGTGYRRALLLRPIGEWGDKMERALRERWEGAGGTIAARAVYSSRATHSESISTALDLNASEQRGRAVARFFEDRLETSGRRRDDVDVVLMLVPTTSEGKSLKPLLDYHYAGNLPVYATSSVNSEDLRVADRDLSGLQLVEIPWVLGSAPAMREPLAQSRTRGATLTRLQALGADAQLLSSRFAQLLRDDELLLRGNTGFLHVNAQGQIVRELLLAEFDRGGLRRR